MKKKRLGNKFLQELEKTPIVSIACERCGVSRNTVYRWRTEDSYFAKRMDEAIEIGDDLVNDVAESNVLKGIKSGNPRYTIFWLERRNKRFRRLLPAHPPVPEEDPEERERKIQEKMKKVIEFQDKWFKRKDRDSNKSI